MYAAISFSVLAASICFVACADECGEPHVVHRARVSDASDDEPYVLGSSVTYKCDPGFITGGVRKTSKCVEDPETGELVWTEPGITCNPRTCGDPGYVANAERHGYLFTFPNYVNYTCKEGYRLSGSPRRYCEASGVWSGRLPTCNVVTCRRPKDPENGRAVYTSLEYNSQLRYECDNDLQISNNQPRRCGPDGEWTDVDPFCRETECELPEEPLFGTVELVGNKATLGSIVIYKCNAGRKLVGSSSSKCLKTGEWNSLTPKCVEPCRVPSVSNGELGTYVEEYKWRRWRTVFKQVSEGSTLDENEKVILKCDENYVPRAEAQREVEITCLDGELLPQPECISTSCEGDPPPIANGRAMVDSREHGYTIWYKCDPDFEKLSPGAVTCNYGIWTGITPACGDTRCHKQSLNYPGLVKGEGYVSSGKSFVPTCLRGYELSQTSDGKIHCNKGKWSGNLPPCTIAQCRTESLLGLNGLVLFGHRTLNDGEGLQPVCSEGFEFSNKNDSTIYCRQGNWEGNLPPCTPAHCFNDPPVPENGRITVIRAKGHGSSVEYECLRFYVMVGENTVECAYGMWSGSPPTCKDSRCYLRNLPRNDGVNLDSGQQMYYSDDKANILCTEGYNLRYPEVYCKSGEWKTENDLSPCQENDCSVERIDNGEIVIQKSEPIKNFWGTQIGTKTFYETVPVGSSATSGTILHAKCNENYKIEEEGSDAEVEIVCSKGEWVPSPVCLLRNRELVVDRRTASEETTTSATIPSDLPNHPANSSSTSSETPGSNRTQNDVRKGNSSSVDASVKDDLDAELLNNSTTENVGELMTTTTTTESPSCSCDYIVDSTVLMGFNGKKLLKFNDKIPSGSIVIFHCKQPGYYDFRGSESLQCPEDCKWHSTVFPDCFTPKDEHITILVYANPTTNMNVDVGGVIRVLPGTELQLSCRVPSGGNYGLKWRTTADSTSTDTENTYDRSRDVWRFFYVVREASYHHSGVYTCYQPVSGGGHRSVTIEVKDIKCPEIAGTEGMSISYSQNRSFGGIATFHCVSPFKRDGPEYVTCESSGMWSGPPGSCKPPVCSMASLFDVVPEGVVPDIDGDVPENFPYHYKLKLQCDQAGRTLDRSDTVTCGEDGNWKAESGIRCIPGCANLKRKNDSELIISPEKQLYRLGDSVIFSCPKGKHLTKGVERMMCLAIGWTPDTTPDCK